MTLSSKCLEIFEDLVECVLDKKYKLCKILETMETTYSVRVYGASW